MSAPGVPGPSGNHGSQRLSTLSERQRKRLIIRSAIRSLFNITVMVLLYYLLPFDHFDAMAGVVLVGGLALMAVLFTRQVRMILRADFPGLRAFEMMVTALPLFLLVFSAVYVMMDEVSEKAFSESLSRSDALYFTITVFATVGFGDIVPRTPGARTAVSLQMIADLAVLGVLVRVVFGAVQTALQRQPAKPERPPDGG